MQFSCLLDLQAPVWGEWLKRTSSVAKGFLSQNSHLGHCASTA